MSSSSASQQQQQQQQQQHGCNLPEDVILDILSWLPVKSLLRFRSVCRLWKDTIKSQSFITKHLLHYYYSTSDIANDRLIVHHYVPERKECDFLMFLDQTLTETSAYEDLDLSMAMFTTMCGPCNGVICLCNGMGRLALWNPATREFRALPKHHPVGFPSKWTAYTNGVGFCLDHHPNNVNGGFKIVWIRKFNRLEYHFTDYAHHVAIYTTSTDCWRELSSDVFPRGHSLQRQLCNTYRNGTYYWLSQRGDFHMVLSFNMSSEAFSEIPGPPEVSGTPNPYFCSGLLSMYGDSIALIHKPNDVSSTFKTFNLWVMEEEEGGYHHWTKKLSIRPLLQVERIIGLWKNGHFFIETSTFHLVLYNPNTGETKDLGCFGSEDSRYIETLVYRDSLVSTMGQNDQSQAIEYHNFRDPDFFEHPPLKCIVYDSDGSGHYVLAEDLDQDDVDSDYDRDDEDDHEDDRHRSKTKMSFEELVVEHDQGIGP